MKITADDFKKRFYSFGIVSSGRLGRTWGARLSGLLGMADQLNDDLVFKNAQGRADWVSHLCGLRYIVDAWRAGDQDASIDPSDLAALVDLAVESWRGPQDGKTVAFPFVCNQKYRSIAERDYRSLQAVLRQDEWKSVVVLAGSCVEAVLLDLVAQADPDQRERLSKVQGKNVDEPERWTLQELVRNCGPEGIGRLDARTVKAADLVRDFRNLVHPGKEAKEDNLITEQDARLAAALVDVVVADLR